MKGDTVRVQRVASLELGEDGLPHGQAVAELRLSITAEYELASSTSTHTEGPDDDGLYVVTVEGVHQPNKE